MIMQAMIIQYQKAEVELCDGIEAGTG